MKEQEKEVALRASDSIEILPAVVKLMENELKYFQLPAGEYPEYVDVFVHYPEVMAKIRIVVKEQEGMQ